MTRGARAVVARPMDDNVCVGNLERTFSHRRSLVHSYQVSEEKQQKETDDVRDKIAVNRERDNRPSASANNWRLNLSAQPPFWISTRIGRKISAASPG
jgi:hypothetical protein